MASAIDHVIKREGPTAERAMVSAASGGQEKRAYVQRIFSEIAPRYDLLNHLLSFNIDRLWRHWALGALGWPRDPYGLYLDLCAGTLDVSAMLAKQSGFRGHVFAADFAEPMLRAGREKVSPEIVTAVTADALQLPLPTGKAAGAIVAFGIRNVVDLEAAFEEVRRVLAPHARFVILDFTTPPSRLVRSVYHAYFHHVLPFVGGLVSGQRTAYRYLPKSVEHFPEPRVLARRLVNAGFSHVRWETLSFGIAAIHVAER